MANQHAKWLKVRAADSLAQNPSSSLNYLLSSLVWRQDHNGFTHQDPGFIDHLMNKKADVVRIYLPPDANHPAFCGRPLPAQQRNYIQPHCGRQAARAAVAHHRRGRRPLYAGVGRVEVGV